MKTLPENNIPFELTLDPVDPIEMVKNAGYESWKDWKFTGEKITKKQTGTFMLVSVGYCKDLDEVREKVSKFGTLPSGQWIEAIKQHYEVNDWIGIADPSWGSPGGRRFPVVGGGGRSSFRWAGLDHGERWRWLVEVGQVSDTGKVVSLGSLESRVLELELKM